MPSEREREREMAAFLPPRGELDTVSCKSMKPAFLARHDAPGRVPESKLADGRGSTTVLHGLLVQYDLLDSVVLSSYREGIF